MKKTYKVFLILFLVIFAASALFFKEREGSIDFYSVDKIEYVDGDEYNDKDVIPEDVITIVNPNIQDKSITAYIKEGPIGASVYLRFDYSTSNKRPEFLSMHKDGESLIIELNNEKGGALQMYTHQIYKIEVRGKINDVVVKDLYKDGDEWVDYKYN